MVQALNAALARAMAEDERVLVLGEDVGVDGGVFRVTDGLLDRFGAGRVRDTPRFRRAFHTNAIRLQMFALLTRLPSFLS